MGSEPFGSHHSEGLAADAGLPVVVSSALESSIGLAMGLHLAASLPKLDYACGLGTAALLAADVVEEPLIAVSGEIPVGRPIPSERLLNQYQAAEDVTEWWLERLADCYEYLDREK